MGIFKEIRNESLIRELQRELNTDVLLFGFDGMVYLGNLQRVENCRIAILTPAMVAASDVEILSPGGELKNVTFLHLDLWQIVAKATGVKSNPLEAIAGLAAEEAPLAPSAKRTEATERQESHELIRTLKRMIGDNVVITTLGGFMFEGTLGDVDDELAFMTISDIYGPATSSSISDADVSTAVINLEALTSVSITATS